jgi:Ubiquitin elongating factor core
MSSSLPSFFVPSRLRHSLPLPKEVPLDFRVLPEYILEDIIDYFFFAVRYAFAKLTIEYG